MPRHRPETAERIALARRILGESCATCDCGWPASAKRNGLRVTPHAPDCALVRAEDDAWDAAGEELYERRLAEEERREGERILAAEAEGRIKALARQWASQEPA